ncbi:hypothetical protein BZA05DRAFT_165567 [Tricharina praecox]|uniref:uncharacterized protein n=1 Tax=Tricharina praecox TaxID=43433 RepID=UPI00221F688E|nr:uncharacterized protein BZA05DRAFT_165567 [Tricharina praecox]KAI5857077.1 hypothetical protein BZA05DRAFT_165567 [Tricharina praecox]
MASYIPEPVKRQVNALNDTYNPLSAAQQPSQAHGKYSYAKGIAYQSYGEAAQSPSWIGSGAQLKAAGVMEMQAAAAGKTAREFTEMLRSGDPGVEEAARMGVDMAGEAGKGLGDGVKMVGGGVGSVGSVLAEKGTDVGRGTLGVGQDVGKGLGEGVKGVGEEVGGGLGKGAGAVGDGVGKGLGEGVKGVGEEVGGGLGKGAGAVGDGVGKGLGGMGLGSWGRR